MRETGRAAALMDRVAGRSRRWRLLMLGALGAVTALGQAPVGAWPLSILGFALAYGLFRRAAGGRQAAVIGWAFGTGYFLVSLNWIIEPFLVDVARHGWMAPFALLGLSGGLALFWALALGLGRAVGGGALGFIGGLGLMELARGYVLTGFPWAQPGHVLIDTPLLHWASYLGSAGLTALLLLAAVALWRAMTGARWALPALGAMALLWPVAAVLTPEAGAGPEAATVRLIQPNAPQHEKWDPDKIQGFFDRQLAFSAAGETRPDVIVWPETAVPVMLENAARTLEVISDAAGGVPVVVGLQRRDEMRLFNTLALVEAGGSVAAVYDKHHLVPFGEYMPYGDQLARFGIHGMAAKDGQGFSSGPGAQVIDMGALGRALPLICYEGVFAQDLRAAPGRADFILLITNDAWFGKFSGPYQHLAQARLRSAEFGLPMIRVANTGVSAMIDATGRITDALPLGEAGWRDAALPPPLPPTVYARLGDAPMLAVFLVLLALSRFGHRRARART
ncbi:MAG: apolipoprotein N-acyltransferase [Roseovarius sp.]|uniref:apolipoprotein N-acyltransferase n=1 Tax=Roseovarius sp. TaxID=1486281 RepID=UPI001B5490FB|nr:apolipoprotein N-acyltransferase [Roseovarius sp.]MBQ0750310.1 apolipoprotein N-acyltransferase [Roseovarius sp.]MBQ0812255.1 apolipoprotein N-acyltransferase [Roseovarius sp.]